MPAALDFEVSLEVISEGYDRKTEWFQPRIGFIAPQTAVLMMTSSQLWGSDIYTNNYEMRSDDSGRTWSDPVAIASLGRRTNGDVEECPCDFTIEWHARAGKLLATGHTATYKPGDRGELVVGGAHRRHMAWSVYDEASRTWQPWQKFEPPDPERFYWASAGCTERVDLPDGDVLLPLSCMDRATLGDNLWKGCFFTTIARFAFDGNDLKYIEHGDELTVTDRRGLYESSLTQFGDRFFLTSRNDLRAHVTIGKDGLHFDEPRPWTFDDGKELGSYNTQQHWVTHSDGLFLTYTRRGANNDRVFRHRAPLFIAQVDPDRLCVLRDTERILVPERGAQLGNFGTINAGPDETWVVTSEGMHGDAKDLYNLDLVEQRGADNRIYLCRLRWNRPNMTVS